MEIGVRNSSVLGEGKNVPLPRGILYLGATISTMLVLSACHTADDRVRQGWVEADLIFIGPDEEGRLELLGVSEGQQVSKGTLLFTLDDDLQQADLAVKRAAVANAQKNFDRAKGLLKSTAGTEKAYDDSEALLRQAKANLAASETRLAHRKVVSPSDGVIERIYYRPGETVLPGQPAVGIVTSQNIKLRFFVSETLLPDIRIGEIVSASCDGCEKALTAKVSFIAHHAEFTPPVIYSLDEREKLVFLIEARPEKPDKFRIGQPVTVVLPKLPQ